MFCSLLFETGLSEDRFHFDKDGDAPARYNIIHFKQVQPGIYKWIKVGGYYEGELRLNMAGKCPFYFMFSEMYSVFSIPTLHQEENERNNLN